MVTYRADLPQLAITLIFFIWPAGQALLQSFQLEDAFGLSREFVGLENFQRLFNDNYYFDSLITTLIFSTSVVLLSMLSAVILAGIAEQILRVIVLPHNTYRSLCYCSCYRRFLSCLCSILPLVY